MPQTLRLILGDQLNLQHSWFKDINPEVLYVIMEIKQEQEYVKHHIQKILGFFAAMRNFAHQLSRQGHKVIYIKLDDKDNLQNFAANLNHLISVNKIIHFECQLPDEYRLDKLLKEFCNGLDITSNFIDSEHFITNREELATFFAGRKSYLMETFYRHMRIRHSILMDGNKPVGGQWNYDAANRSKYDGKVPLKNRLAFDHNLSELKTMIDGAGIEYFGEVDAAHFEWPLSAKEAQRTLDYFCDELLPYFGTYEDAMLQEHISLFHSRLSFALNVKMISPMHVVRSVLATWARKREGIGLTQVEGFVRQIIGWREFMRGVYWAKMPEFAELNFFDHGRKLPGWFWTGETKMNCLSKCISQSLNYAWAHHIQRLMVIGNFALLTQTHPDEVDTWYLGVYIDAIEWVEITNTRGMSQYADGGVIGSKPYIASAAYINRMSDYCKGCHYDYTKKHGKSSCPFNSLYWNFMATNENKLSKNPRMSMMYKNFEKQDKKERDLILKQAEYYLDQIESL
ncbi:MAG: cryptochrome/photolyase family protein [Mucilaginibacter sp.]